MLKFFTLVFFLIHLFFQLYVHFSTEYDTLAYAYPDVHIVQYVCTYVVLAPG